jgi:hypothetical protein
MKLTGLRPEAGGIKTKHEKNNIYITEHMITYNLKSQISDLALPTASSLRSQAFYFLLPLALSLLLLLSTTANAHHVLGRPAYSLNEDSNTPPSMQVETQIGDYYVTYMIFPAFPKAGERGRVNLYATRIDNGDAYAGEVTFIVRDDVFFGDENEETLGTQPPNDSVFRQGFVFSENGDYIITAEFTADNQPYTIDFPMRIGPPKAYGPIGIAVTVIVVILLGVNLVQRKRLLRSKIRKAHEETTS